MGVDCKRHHLVSERSGRDDRPVDLIHGRQKDMCLAPQDLENMKEKFPPWLQISIDERELTRLLGYTMRNFLFSGIYYVNLFTMKGNRRQGQLVVELHLKGLKRIMDYCLLK